MNPALPLATMSVEEKLRVMEELWDDLRRDEANVPTPHWHKELLDERERLVKEGKARFSDWESVKRRINRAVA